MSKFKDRWANRAFEGVSSYTQSDAPSTLQDVIQGLFCRATIARIEEHIPEAGIEYGVDVACGVGDWTVEYLKWAKRVSAIDVNASFLEETKRRLEKHPRGGQATLVCGDALEFDGFEGAEFVALGAVTMYFTDEDLERLVKKISDAQPGGGLLYVRSTISDPRGERFETEGGIYRLKQSYDGLFERQGYEAVFCEHSATIVAAYLMSRMGVGEAAECGPRLEGVIKQVLWRGSSDSAYYNWLLRRV